jgi:hypothetical protein
MGIISNLKLSHRCTYVSIFYLVERPSPALTYPSVVTQNVGMALKDPAERLDCDLVTALHL